MIWLAFARKYAGVIAGAAVVALLLYGLNRALHRADLRGYDRARGEQAAQVVKANAITAKREAEARRASQIQSAQWESTRSELQNQIGRLLSQPRAAIRLCKQPAGGGQLPGATSAAGRTDDRTGAAINDVSSSPDIAGAILVYGGDCERYRRQLSALQDWVKRIETPGPVLRRN